MPRFPPRGSRGRLFPRFDGTIKALRLPALRPAALRCLRLAVPWEHACFAPAVDACGNVGPGVGHPVSPPGLSSVETAGSPKFLGNPDSRLPMFFDPGRPMRPRPLAGHSPGPRYGNDEGADNVRLSRLNSMAFGLAAYVSRCWLPVTAQGWLPGAGQALLGGLSPAGFR